jgi:peptidoglycan-N-acetylglucosamine deacetylase
MLASISLDLDNKWSYLKTHGDSEWESFPTYLPNVVPRILEILAKIELPITFFIVGQDAVRAENQSVLADLATAGHEIANHSFHHEPWLHLYSADQLEEEFQRSEQAIFECTGRKTLGFRGPGFSYSPSVLSTLKARGYQYDGSIFPTYLGPLARAFYFFRSSLSRKEKDQRKQLFGSFRNGFLPLKPFRWQSPAEGLVEIPVTTMPLFKVPIHFSYIMYLATFSTPLAIAYFKSAMEFCRLNRVEPSLLLHPLDFLGQDEEPKLAFLPGMSHSSKTKSELAERLLGWMKRRFECVNMAEHAEELKSRNLRSMQVA